LSSAPQTDGWMFKLALDGDVDTSAFMSSDEYQQFVASNA
jgi:glycine cleavage system H lipoate-binding protein